MSVKASADGRDVNTDEGGLNSSRMKERRIDCVESCVGNIRVSTGWTGKGVASGPLHPSFVIGDQSDKADKRQEDNGRTKGTKSIV